MVTADQNHLQLRPPGPPPSDRGERRRRDAAGPRVEQVAEDNEAACTGPGQHAVEPGEIVARGPPREREAARAECRGLAPMNIRDTQRLLSLPVEAPLGEEMDALASEVDRRVGTGIGSRSAGTDRGRHGGSPFERQRHAAHPVRQLLRADFFAAAVHKDRESQRCGARHVEHCNAAVAETHQSEGQTTPGSS